MILDHRPAIDQITEPTPLNVVHEVLRALDDKVRDDEQGLSDLISDSLGVLDPILEDHMGKHGLDEANNALHVICGDMAAAEADRQLDRIREFASALEARL